MPNSASLVPIDEVAHFDVVTHNPATGAVSDADSTPTFAVYEEATDTAILDAQNFTKRTSLTGNYRGTFTASAANGFEAGKWYSVIASATVNSVAAKCVAMNFRVAPAESVAGVPKVDPSTWDGTDITTGVPLAPTTAGRTLDVSAGGEAGVDWANVGSPTTTLNLSGTTVKTATDVETDTADIQTRLPASLSSGRIDASVGAMQNNVLTAAAINADAITDAKVASDVTIASVTGAVGSVTGAVGSVTGAVGSVAAGGISASSFAAGAINAAAIASDAITDAKVASDVTIASVTGAVGSVTGAVGSVTGAVGSVTGAVGSVTGNVGGNVAGSVGSVTGNVGGNVTGSVGSVATGGIAASSFAAGAIDAAAIATNAIGSDELAASAITEIQSGLSTLDAAGVRTAVGLASANLDTQLDTIDNFLDTEIAAIKAKTDNLPSDPADASDIASAFSTVNSTLTTIAGYLDTEIAAIKAKTDGLTFTVAGYVDSNIQYVNDVAVTGTGAAGNTWGPA